jgi:hypothetical protein
VRYDYTCLYCGYKGRAPGTGELDHLIPKAAGGINAKQNRAWACDSCNGVKKHMGPISFACWLLENRASWRNRGKGAAALSYFAKDPWAILKRRLYRIYSYNQEGRGKYEYLEKWYERYAPDLLSFKVGCYGANKAAGRKPSS